MTDRSPDSSLLNGVDQFMRGNTRFKPASAEIYIVPLRIGSGTEIFIFPDAVWTAVKLYRGKIGTKPAAHLPPDGIRCS